MFGVGVLATALLTLPTPLLTTVSPYLLVSLRVVEGLFEVSLPASVMHLMQMSWDMVNETVRLQTSVMHLMQMSWDMVN